jgi:hypothetical protein
MNGPFATLEDAGRIERVSAGRAEVERLHAIVARDVATAGELRERDRDWALAIVYNALLQACLALMAAHGYRARGEDQHRTAIEFARLALPEHVQRLDRVDRLRRRRHRTVYTLAGEVTEVDLNDAFALAEQLLPLLRETALRALE